MTGLFDSHLDTPIDQMQQLNDPNSVAEIDMPLNESDQMSESDSIIDQIQLVRLSIQELNFNILENQQIFLESRSDESLPKKLNTFTTAWKNQEDTYDTDIATEQTITKEVLDAYFEIVMTPGYFWGINELPLLAALEDTPVTVIINGQPPQVINENGKNPMQTIELIPGSHHYQRLNPID